ncbi:VG15 protein [Corynebacterium variabile]
MTMTTPLATSTADRVATGAARLTYAATRDLVVDAAHRELTAFWKTTAALPPKQREAATVKFMVGLVKQYGEVAGASAADYLATEWAEWGAPYTNLGYPEVVDPPATKTVRKSASWALQTTSGGLAVADPDEAFTRLLGVATRLLLSSANKTVARGAARAGVKFARVAEADACAFCQMLASRGGVYHDSSTALTGDASKYHDRCRCTAIQVRDDQELPPTSQRLMREWAAWADNHDGQPTLQAWAAHQYEHRKS